ncbi:MAG: hypothetical protein LC112_13155 [Flavobacteriales bacterium]|nr:hypothetical protein [Flavobacteriales bacterium]
MLRKNTPIIAAAKMKIVFCLCSAFFINSVYSQTNRLDSINITDAEKDLRINNPEIAFDDNLLFSDAYLFYNQDDLQFKRVQTPEKTTKFGFGAKGIFRFNPKIILSGNLEVTSENEKEVAYILTDERTTDQNYISNPSYFYVPRKSDWLKQNYKIGGNLAYKITKNLIFVANVNGEFLKAYGQSDPRPEIGNFKYDTNAKLGYQIGKHRLFAKMGYFNRRKESDIIYTVSELNAPNYFETYIRFNEGYGNYYYNNGYSATFYKYDGVSYGGEYQFVGDKSFFSLSYQNEYYIDRMQKDYSYQIRDANNVLQTYYDRQKLTGLKTDRNTISANYLGNLGSFKWNSMLNVTDQKDINYDYVNLYTSYRALNTNFDFSNTFTKYNAKNELLRFGFNLNYQDLDIKDISVVLHKKLNALQYQINGEKEFRVASNQKLSLGVNHSLYLPLENELDYVPYQSNQENIFVKNIVQPDYWYDSSSRFSLGLQLKYRFDLKNVRYEIVATGNQTYFMKNDLPVKNLINTNENRFLGFGFNVYY